jgi:diguanylate cyclase (GGDEF)-like protein
MAPASSTGPAQTPARERRKVTASTWSTLGPTARIYVGAVTAAGGLALCASMPYAVSRDTPLFVALTALSILTSMAKVSLPVSRSGSTLTVCYVFDFTALIVLGPYAATVTAGLGAWSQCTFRRREPVPLFQTWFSVGALAVTVQATGYVYTLLGGHIGLPLASFNFEALIVASTVFFLVNSILVAMAVALSTGQSTGRVWMASYLWSWPGHLVGFALAVGASFGIGRSQLWLIPFSVVSLALTYENFNAYVTRFTDSVTDPLTGLANVRHLLAQAAQELARSKRDGSPMAVLVVDLDGFKAINDSCGHNAGDAALREVARCLQQSTRVYDVCARYGGDEFVAVLAGCDLDDAMRKASALRSAVASLRFQPKSEPVSLAVSVGVAVFPEDGDTFETLLAAADARMFADKEGHADREPRAGRRGKHEHGRAEAVDPQLQQRIMEAQRMEAVGQLAGGVAHDFNNALTAILGYSDMLTEQIGPDKPIGRDLKEIVGAAQHAASLTHQLLAFSRKQALATAEIDLNDVVTLADAMLRRLLGERIAIATGLADDLHTVMANATQLEQIVVNLSVNGRDAMMPAGGTLTLETRNVEVAEGSLPHAHAKPGAYALLSVTDTGSGMTPEVQAKIFDAFFTTKEPGKGTGLGLAAVQGIVAQLGGFVLVQSELGVGSTFQIFLPSTNHVASVRAAEPAPSVANPAPIGLETILLVEDEAAVRQFATIALERHGYRVLEAHSAEAALTLLERLNSPVHLILTDVVLPGLDGFELAARVECSLPGVPVLFTTGYCDGFNQALFSDNRETALLHKPFTARALLEKTREILDSRRVA